MSILTTHIYTRLLNFCSTITKGSASLTNNFYLIEYFCGKATFLGLSWQQKQTPTGHLVARLLRLAMHLPHSGFVTLPSERCSSLLMDTLWSSSFIAMTLNKSFDNAHPDPSTSLGSGTQMWVKHCPCLLAAKVPALATTCEHIIGKQKHKAPRQPLFPNCSAT